MVRGEVFRLRAARGARGGEQHGARFAVVVQADELVEQTTPVTTDRLGDSVGRLDAHELRALDAALAVILGL